MVERPVEHPPAPDPVAQDAHLRLLSLIEQHPDYSQRRLAEALGVSLGKAHYLLKALFDKGLVKADKFTRSPEKLRYVYALTPAGVKHRLQLTRRFLQVKEREYLSLKSEIEQLRAVLDADKARPGARAPEAGDAAP
jgi:EPS-associated MarR family transcriptional regulator